MFIVVITPTNFGTFLAKNPFSPKYPLKHYYLKRNIDVTLPIVHKIKDVVHAYDKHNFKNCFLVDAISLIFS